MAEATFAIGARVRSLQPTRTIFGKKRGKGRLGTIERHRQHPNFLIIRWDDGSWSYLHLVECEQVRQ